MVDALLHIILIKYPGHMDNLTKKHIIEHLYGPGVNPAQVDRKTSSLLNEIYI